MRKINEKLAILLTNAVGSMYMAYSFTLLALISLPAALKTGDVVIIVAWIAQTFLQLVLLSVIMVGQNIQSQASQDKLDQVLNLIESQQQEELQELKDDKEILQKELEELKLLQK